MLCRSALLVLGVLSSCATLPENLGPTKVTPESVGLSSALLADHLPRVKTLALDSLLITHQGRTVLDLTVSPYEGSMIHDLASVTKGVMALLFAMACDQGYTSLDDPVLGVLPPPPGIPSAKLRSLTWRHLLGMTSGLRRPGDPDQYLETVLREPLALTRLLVEPVFSPGSTFWYDSGNFHLVALGLEKLLPEGLEKFAEQELFLPLGISDWFWEKDRDGTPWGGGNLHLTPEGASRIGQLMLQGGRWGSRTLLSKDLVQELITPARQTPTGDRYGLGWWIQDQGYAAIGRGGQRIQVLPARNLVVVITGYGVTMRQVEELLGPTIPWWGLPLPDDSEGTKRLEATLADLRKSDQERWLGEPFPPGWNPKTKWRGGGPGLQETWLRMEPQGTSLILYTGSNNREHRWEVGLDGRFRRGNDGAYRRGRWKGDTLAVEELKIGHKRITLHFQEDIFEVQEGESQ